MEILNIYVQASGKKVNFQKRAITLSKGTSSKDKHNLTGISKLEGVGRYLGLPEVVRKNKNDMFSFIKQRVIQKFENLYFPLQEGSDDQNSCYIISYLLYVMFPRANETHQLNNKCY